LAEERRHGVGRWARRQQIDIVDPLRRRRPANAYRWLQVSEEKGEGLDEARERIGVRFEERFER